MKIKVIDKGETELEITAGSLWLEEDSNIIYILICTEGNYRAFYLKDGTHHWSGDHKIAKNAVVGLIPFTGTLEISN